jgi:molybdate transport system substrate-binding protein
VGLVTLSALLLGSWSSAGLAAEELTISAASLTNVFSDVAEAFCRGKPKVTVIFNFGASGALFEQIDSGAPVDVFASADRETMDGAESTRLVDRASRRDFATNRLLLAAPAGARVTVRTLRDLGKPRVARVAVGSPEFVPPGRYARQALKCTGLWAALAPKLVLGSTIRQVLDYLARSEVDAGFVFATDVVASRSEVVAVEDLKTREPVVYPAAVVSGSAGKGAARRFVGFLSGSEARAILSKHD